MRSFPLVILLLLSALATKAQSVDSTYTFYSDAFEAERELRIYLPRSYAEDSETPYNVAYILDAQLDELWNMATGTIGYLDFQYQIIPTIVVGIVSDSRGAEFSPNNTELTEHFREEVIPFVESNFRVGGIRSVVGHSWGGAFVGNTLFGPNNDLFDAYLGISPSLVAIDGRILQAADSMLNQEPLPKVFYCSSGTIGIQEYESQLSNAEMDSLVQVHQNERLIWELETFSDLDHWSCFGPSLNNGMLFISRQYFPDQFTIRALYQPGLSLVDQLEAFWEFRQENYGYAFHPSAGYWNFVASGTRELGDYDLARQLYELIIAEGKEKPVVTYNLAECYQELDMKDKAIELYNRTLELLEAQKEDLSEQFYKDLKAETNTRLEDLK